MATSAQALPVERRLDPLLQGRAVTYDQMVLLSALRGLASHGYRGTLISLDLSNCERLTRHRVGQFGCYRTYCENIKKY